VLDHLEACPTNDFSHVAISYTRENEHSTEGRNKISVLGAARTHWAYLVGNCGVVDGQVAGDTALNELFEDDVSSGDTHLGSAGTCVINLDRNARTRDGLSTKLKTGQRMTRDVSLDGLFDRLDNFFSFINLIATGATGKNEGQGN
jgi:hypothetical protein